MTEPTVTMSIETYQQLIDLKTRVDVLVDMVCRNGYIELETILGILGTDEALIEAARIREKKEELKNAEMQNL